MKLSHKILIVLVAIGLLAAYLYFSGSIRLADAITIDETIQYIKSGRISTINDGDPHGRIWVYDEEKEDWIPVNGKYSELINALEQCAEQCANVKHLLN